MDNKLLQETVNQTWDESIIPNLVEFIKIPNKSPDFDPKWQQHGYMDQAVDLIVNWCQQQNIKGLQLEVCRLENRTPLIFMEIPGDIDDTILLYGHLDKQPEMSGWDKDLGPWKPVIKDNKLYGRGGADDGYAAFASLTAIKVLQDQNIPHARCVVIIEACEESGSYDLPPYLEHLADKIGNPNLVICLDSGAANYDQIWSTTSLRGLIGGELTIETASAGVHSGAYSGAMVEPSRIFRLLMDRIENSKTGEILVKECQALIPEQRIEQAKIAAEMLGDEKIKSLPLLDGVKPVTTDVAELILNSTWRATLCVTGQRGLPKSENAGNVLRPKLTFKLSIRLAPTVKPETAVAAVKKVLEENPPYNARITFTPEASGSGWNAPPLSEWLEKATDEASTIYFGKGAAYLGEGGSIPFMGLLGEQYPKAQFLITGLLGPHSNAHGPNEFLHIPMGKNLTASVAHVIAKHYEEFQS